MIVVDSSVAAKWLFADEHSPQADALVQGAIAAAEPLLAPALLPIEVTNIIWQHIKATDITAAQGHHLLEDFLTYPIDLRTSTRLHLEALILSETYALPAVYDAHYLALAQEFSATLWTADQRLLRALAGKLHFVRFIADYPL